MHKKYRKPLFAISLLLLVFGVLAIWFSATVNVPDPGPFANTIEIDGVVYQTDIADTDEKRQQGLGGRAAIEADEAMLFIFEQPGKHCFWMKDVDFSLDILWFNEDFKLVYAEVDVLPATYPDNFCPDVPAAYVVELQAGQKDAQGFDNGSQLTIDKR